MSKTPLHHLVRIRTTGDLTYVRAGIMDEVIVDANQLENNPASTATALRRTTLPFCVDPVLYRFQLPEWWRNHKGNTKRNFARLGRAYVEGTDIAIADGPLLDTVPNDAALRTLAVNCLQYQQHRLVGIPAQLDLLEEGDLRELNPSRLMAPALVAFSCEEDRINRLLAEASAEASGAPIALPIIVPFDRLMDQRELAALLRKVPTDGIGSYFVWTADVPEELLLKDHHVFDAVQRLIDTLATRGIPVGHLHGGYVIAALHDLGVSAVVHHLGWVDKGEPAGQTRGGMRSCQVYVPGVRHCVRFDQARDLGRNLDPDMYVERFCECAFCSGALAEGQRPLDLLLEDQFVPYEGGPRGRRTPTSRAVTLHTWHYLLSRRLEIQAFSTRPAIEVIERDMERAAALSGKRAIDRLEPLAAQLRSA